MRAALTCRIHDFYEIVHVTRFFEHDQLFTNTLNRVDSNTTDQIYDNFLPSQLPLTPSSHQLSIL